MRRRDILLGLSAISGAAAISGIAAWTQSGALPSYPPLPSGDWSNWARNQKVKPKRIMAPNTPEALRDIITANTGTIRAAGSGHSFTALVPNEDTIISLENMSGVISTDADAKIAKVHAGSRLHDLSKALESEGLAFKNLGDVDVQTLAGAISTATHGTGQTFPCLSAEILGVKLMTAAGDIVEINAAKNSDMLGAVQVSLGALGIILEADVALRPSYRLHRKTWTQPLSQTLVEAKALWETHRNFEFYYIPYSGQTLCISNELTDEPATPRPTSEDDEGVMELKRARDFLKRAPRTRRKVIGQALADAPKEDTVGISWQLLATERNVRFTEMEYHLPEDMALDTLAEIIDLIEKERPDVFFPIEVRRTAADTAWLSPFQGKGRISIAVHCLQGEDFAWMFKLLEPVFRRAGGRPHWGKLNSLGAQDLTALYPDFERFMKLRNELDPKGRFLSPYMRKLFMV